MPVKLVAPVAHERYQLTILSYSDEAEKIKVCEIIYDSKDKNLLASLSDLPYTVGRSFPSNEVKRVSEELRTLHVGYRFKNLNDETQVIEFIPQSKEESVSQSIESKRVPLSKPVGKRRLRPIVRVLLPLLSIMIVAAILFSRRQDSTPQTPIEGQENFQAKVESIVNDVEFRRHPNFIWEKAPVGQGLLDQDGLRTYENSSATVIYQEGSRVTVKPNTLIVIGKNNRVEDRKIRLEDGVLQARLKPSLNPARISIETKAGTLEVKGPKPGEQAKETRIETKISQGQLQVNVAQGSATLRPVATTAQSLQIDSRQSIIADEKSVSTITAYTPPLEVYDPPANLQIQFDPDSENKVLFRWENIGENTSYRLNIAGDPQMKNILLSQESPTTNLELHYLDPGSLYWQVTGTFEGTLYQSEIRKLYVQEPGH